MMKAAFVATVASGLFLYAVSFAMAEDPISRLIESINEGVPDQQQPPADRPKKPTKEELLEMFDENDDGKLTGEERDAVRKFLAEKRAKARENRPEDGPPRRKRPTREEILEKFDEDGDGKLSADEREKAKAAARERREGRGRPHISPQMRKKILEQFDEDGDGQITGKEKEKAIAALRKRFAGRGRPSREQVLEKFDEDGDGQLNKGERAKAQQFFRNQRQNRQNGAQGQRGQRRNAQRGQNGVQGQRGQRRGGIR